MDALERQDVVTIDILLAFLCADMYDIAKIKTEGAMAELLTRVDPCQYEKSIVMEKWKKVLYMSKNKSLYGTLKAALLFRENLSINIMNK